MITGTSKCVRNGTHPLEKVIYIYRSGYPIYGTHNMGIPLLKIYPLQMIFFHIYPLVQYTLMRNFILRVENIFQTKCRYDLPKINNKVNYLNIFRGALLTGHLKKKHNIISNTSR